MGLMHLPQLALGRALDVGPETAGEPSVEQSLGVAVGEGSDHAHYMPVMRSERQAFIPYGTGDSRLSLR